MSQPKKCGKDFLYLGSQGGVMKKWLVSLDTDKVKEFVFATGRLKEIRGASALLDRLNRITAPKELADEQLIFTGGGSLLAEFTSEDQAIEYSRSVQELYRQQTNGAASITGVVVDYDDDQAIASAPKSFASAFKRAASELRKAKGSGSEITALLNRAFWQPCDRCGSYPASMNVPSPDGGSMHLCETCAAKRSEIDTPGTSNSAHQGLLERLAKAYGADWPGNDWVPNEIEQLGNYVGFIYADGNGIGKIIEEYIHSPEDLKAFSKGMEASATAAIAAIAHDWQSKNPGCNLPLIPILSGGDDIIVIANATYALDIANSICLGFQSEAKKQLGANFPLLSMSAGVVIAKAKHPIFELQRLSEELLVSAKRLSRQLSRINGLPVCALDFRIITSPSANAWPEVYQFEYRLPDLPGQNQEHWATCRPYPCSPISSIHRPAITDLLAAVRSLKGKEQLSSGLPRNKIHAWQNLLRVEPALKVELELSILRSHLSTSQKSLLRKAAEQLCLPTETSLFLTDPLDPIRLISPLPDIVEVEAFAGALK